MSGGEVWLFFSSLALLWKPAAPWQFLRHFHTPLQPFCAFLGGVCAQEAGHVGLGFLSVGADNLGKPGWLGDEIPASYRWIYFIRHYKDPVTIGLYTWGPAQTLVHSVFFYPLIFLYPIRSINLQDSHREHPCFGRDPSNYPLWN